MQGAKPTAVVETPAVGCLHPDHEGYFQVTGQPAAVELLVVTVSGVLPSSLRCRRGSGGEQIYEHPHTVSSTLTSPQSPLEYMTWYRREGPLRHNRDAPVAAVLLYRKHVITEQPYIRQLIRGETHCADGHPPRNRRPTRATTATHPPRPVSPQRWRRMGLCRSPSSSTALRRTRWCETSSPRSTSSRAYRPGLCHATPRSGEAQAAARFRLGITCNPSD